MSLPDPNARHLARTLDALTTQVRRVADALSTPVVRAEATADDAPTTTADAPGPATGEDEEQALRWARRESFLLLLARAERGVLSPAEGRMIREHVEHEMREADTARAAAGALAEERNEAWADLRRAHKASSDLAEKIREQREFLARVRAELEQAQATIDRVRAALKVWAATALPRSEAHQVVADVRAALDGTDQPTTKE